MSEFYEYPSIATLKTRREILKAKEVVACEKLHGTNFRLLFPAGITSPDQVVFGSRDRVLGTADSEEAQKFYNGRPVKWFTERRELLAKLIAEFASRGYGDTILFAEACGSSIQGGVLYSKRHTILVRSFDIMVEGVFVDYDTFVEVADGTGMPRVPEIWRGVPSQEAFDALLERASVEAAINGVVDGCNIWEGVVIRAIPMGKTRSNHWLIIKHKSKKFDEVVANGIRLEKLRLEPCVLFAKRYVVEGRMLNVLGRLRDHNTELKGEMSDMQFIGPAMLADVRKEAGDDWQALIDLGFLNEEVERPIKSEAGAVYRAMVEPAQVVDEAVPPSEQPPLLDGMTLPTFLNTEGPPFVTFHEVPPHWNPKLDT